MPAYDHGVEVAATSRVRLHTILTLMGFAVLIVGIISAIPHPSSAIENLLVIGLFLFIALCLAIVTILLSLAEGGIRADRGRK
jgi:hypothetical protein